jgi:hypothetical protein
LVVPGLCARWGLRIAFSVVVIGCGLVGTIRGDEPAEVELIRFADFPKGWVHVSAEKGASLSDTWRVVKGENGGDDVLKCIGKPFGYLLTEIEYENFEFSLEWNYPKDPNCNSGILVHTGKEKKIWPRSIQVQLHRPAAGSIFPGGGANTDRPFEVKNLDLPVGKWHACKIASRRGRVSVTINGRKLGGVSGCVPQRGGIALQSEGSEIHFRRIRVRVFDD